MTVSKYFHLSSFHLAMLALILVSIASSSSLPLRNVRSQQQLQATEVEKSLLNGSTAALWYSHLRNFTASPLSTDNPDVTRVLETVCDLLAYTELVGRLNSTDCGSGVEAIYSILKENFRDSCEWIKELNNTGLVRLDSDLVSPLSCSLEMPTFLHLHCYRARLNPVISNSFTATTSYFASHESFPSNPTVWVQSRINNQVLQRKIINVIDPDN